MWHVGGLVHVISRDPTDSLYHRDADTSGRLGSLARLMHDEPDDEFLRLVQRLGRTWLSPLLSEG